MLSASSSPSPPIWLSDIPVFWFSGFLFLWFSGNLERKNTRTALKAKVTTDAIDTSFLSFWKSGFPERQANYLISITLWTTTKEKLSMRKAQENSKSQKIFL